MLPKYVEIKGRSFDTQTDVFALNYPEAFISTLLKADSYL